MTIKAHQTRFSKFLLLAGLIWSVIGLFSCTQKQQESTIETTTEVVSMETVSSPTLKIAKELLTLKPAEGLVYHEDKPFTGIGMTYFGDSTNAERTSYWAGKKHGVKRKWFPDGTLSFEAHYKMGKQDSTTKTWWKNGNLRSESRFSAGVPDGVQQQWYLSGAKFKLQNLVQGKEEGMQKAWRENGKIYNNYEAKNGRYFGLKRASLCYELDDEKVQYGEKK